MYEKAADQKLNQSSFSELVQVARLCDKSPVPGHDFTSAALAIIGVPFDETPWADHASESLAKVPDFLPLAA